MEIARDNRLPYINFVESAGGDLRMGTGKKGDQPPIAPTIGHTHFAATGRYFYDLTELSKMRIPVISIVFGSSTAGGAYQPGMSDYNIFVKDQAKVFLAGPPLVKMATGEVSDDETLGGAKMHSEVSGLSDYLAEDEMDALRLCRNVVSHLHWIKEGPSPLPDSDCPSLSQEELLGLVDEELKSPLDIREVIGRIVDGSRFEEYKPLYGKTMICGWSMLHGYPVGILGNNGPIYPESAEKAATFIQLCNKRSMPLIFLQNVTGFLVGKDFERQAIIKKGSQLINAVSNSNVPHITIIIGASFGAGTYAMSGRAYNNRFTFLWPTAKIAVMGSKQIAGVMSIVRRGQAARKGEKFDEKQDAEIVKMVEQMSDQMSEGLVASSMVTDDGIIDPRDTRSVIGFCLSIVSNSSIDGAKEYGVFRL
jgi:acetyl-CoA carboxylase carboxyltransferase component